MPFKSEAQRRYLYATHSAIAKRFQEHTPKGAKLPKKITDSDPEETRKQTAKEKAANAQQDYPPPPPNMASGPTSVLQTQPPQSAQPANQSPQAAGQQNGQQAQQQPAVPATPPGWNPMVPHGGIASQVVQPGSPEHKELLSGVPAPLQSSLRQRGSGSLSKQAVASDLPAGRAEKFARIMAQAARGQVNQAARGVEADETYDQKYVKDGGAGSLGSMGRLIEGLFLREKASNLAGLSTQVYSKHRLRSVLLPRPGLRSRPPSNNRRQLYPNSVRRCIRSSNSRSR